MLAWESGEVVKSIVPGSLVLFDYTGSSPAFGRQCIKCTAVVAFIDVGSKGLLEFRASELGIPREGHGVTRLA